MKTLYLDCFAGISGDMFVGALLELIPDPSLFKKELSKLKTLSAEDYTIEYKKTSKSGITGTQFEVKTHEHHPHRGLKEIEEIIMSSELSDKLKREIVRAFALLAEAEAQVHGTTPDKIHFHEVGAIDSIVDIAGAFILVDMLGWPRILSSPLNIGSGTVKCAHGVLPVPAPATELLLHGLPVYAQGTPMERTTPTGALLVRCLVEAFSSIPSGIIQASGYGLGQRDSDIPNVLRVLSINTSERKDDLQLAHDQTFLIESNIDDMNPQDYDLLTERLFENGALDVWIEPIIMKKGRPALKFCCLCEPEKTDLLSLLIIQNSTTQGIRKCLMERSKLCYKIEEIKTSLGSLRIKVAVSGQTPVRCTPEYEDLKRLAKENNLSLPEVRSRVAHYLSLSNEPITK